MIKVTIVVVNFKIQKTATNIKMFFNETQDIDIPLYR
jgi:hypothetical protein